MKRSVRKIAGKSTLKPASAPSNGAGFDGLFSAPRGLLAPYENRLALKVPRPAYCYVESRTPTFKNRPMYFAGVRTGKNYVSYYLKSVYSTPELVQAISRGLKKHMHGKVCFNFTEVDPELLRELARLTEAGYHKFKSMKYL